jgi:3-oxoadipate enol-lactonase
MNSDRINGVEMTWREAGSGEPIVFLHGFPLHAGMWEPQLTDLPAGWRGIAPSVRGFGGSELGAEPASSMDLLAADVAALLDRLGIARVTLCGLSMGGYVALAFVRKYPERLRGLVLCDTRAGADSEDGRRNRYELAERVRIEGVGPVRDAMLPKLISGRTRQEQPEVESRIRAMIEEASPEAVARALTGMAARPDSTPFLREITVPTLVLVGAEDAVTPPGEAQLLVRGIPGARIETVADAGHLSNLEQPATFNRSLWTFLQSSLDPNALSFTNLTF